MPLQQSFRHVDLDGTPVDFEHARVRAVWSDDLARVSVINKRVAVVTGRAELSQRVRDGLDAHRRGDLEVAADQLGQARQLAQKSQDAQMLPAAGAGGGHVAGHRLHEYHAATAFVKGAVSPDAHALTQPRAVSGL
ncbi:MAG: hypothetical protein M3Z25_08960 [Actinomycetota bacterium]|nr:hypothetical protein [Actinomycetota bacterium]